MRTGIIYIATSRTSGKSYIGQTIQKLSIRIGRHKQDSKTFNNIFYKAIRELGWEDFEWETLATTENDKNTIVRHLNHLEKKFVFMYDTYKTGYNSTKGGGGGKGGKFFSGKKHSKKIRAKISAALKGRKLSKEWRDKIKTANTGKKHTQEQKDKIAAAHTGMKRSKEARGNMSRAAKRRKNKC